MKTDQALKTAISAYLREIASKGGKTTAANMTKEERKTRAKNAAAARWKGKRKGDK